MSNSSYGINHLFQRIDFKLLIVTAAIVIYGLIMISSATHINTPSEDRFWYLQRQGIVAVLDVIFMIFLINLDYRLLRDYAKVLYVFNLIMLILVIVFGHTILGAQRWLQIGSISLQPSEFSKLIMIICMASLLENRIGNLNTLRSLLPVTSSMIIPFILILKQPDLGTSLVLIAIFLGMVMVAGMPWKIFLGLLSIGVASIPLLWRFMKDYQKMRLMVFLDPNVDPLGSGYHIIQSKIAIGSGELFGKGLFCGTQSQLNFLPENHTDFIFSVVGEEFGFVGTTVLLLLYLIIFWRGIKIAMEAVDNFGRLLAVGIISMFAFHVLVNVGMTVGIMPITGIPLPLMSYGVSSLTTNILAVTILMNIHLHRHKFLL